MSLASVLAFLSTRPVVGRAGRSLVVRTAPLTRLLCLWAYDRCLSADPDRSVVEVETRLLWGLRRRSTIPFDRIDHIDYGCSASPSDWSGDHGEASERYSIDLALVSPRERLRVASFGSERAGRELVEALRDTLGVTVGLPVPHIADGAGRKRACTACGRPSPPNKQKCQYCGAPVEVVEGPPEA